MMGLLLDVTQVLVVVLLVLVIGWMVRGWMRSEVRAQIDRKLELEVRRSRATHTIRDEMRRTSKAMIDAALNVQYEDVAIGLNDD